MLNKLKDKNFSVLIPSFVFIIINSIITYYYEFIYFPFVSIAILMIVITLIDYRKTFFIIAFLTPLSLNLSFFTSDIPYDLSLFTEPMLALILAILLIKYVINKSMVNKEIQLHPVSLFILLSLAWGFITAISSTITLVSLKAFVAKSWFILPMFYLGVTIFKKYNNIKLFLWIIGISTSFIVVYSTLRLGAALSSFKSAIYFAVKPFYNDHTAYGAALALIVPIYWGLTFKSKLSAIPRFFVGCLAFILTVGVIFSFSRAAWISLFIILLILFAIKLRIKFKYIAVSSLVVVNVIFTFWYEIIDFLQKNNQDSSTNLSKHVLSITNISTDASNVERINRWYCALEMFKKKPIFGWGPGTYQFEYAPFQLARMRTIISTDFGDVGNAHSEYLGLLAEQGLIGATFFILIAIYIILTGFRVHKKANDKEIKTISMSITLGFVTYFIHGLLNNFLDTDKLAVPFWGLAAILVALDLYHTPKNKVAMQVTN